MWWGAIRHWRSETRQRKEGAEEASLTDCSRYKQSNYKWRCCTVRGLTSHRGAMKCETIAYIQYRILNGVLGSSYEDYVVHFLQSVDERSANHRTFEKTKALSIWLLVVNVSEEIFSSWVKFWTHSWEIATWSNNWGGYFIK